MNKQGLIEKIKKAITDELSRNYYREVDNYGHTEYEHYTEDDAQSVADDIILDLQEEFEQLDEPQKPVVPQFVAEYIEENRDEINVTVYEGFTNADGEVAEWLFKNSTAKEDVLHQNNFSRAWLNGYEVEKEPLYRVKLGEGYFVEYQGRGALITPDGNKEIKIFDSKSDAERTASTIGGTVEEVAEG